MTINVKEISDKDRNSVLHPFTQLKAFASGELGDPTIVETGKGIRIQDAHGNHLIDGFAGLYCVNVGYEPRLPRLSRVRPFVWPITTPTPPTRRTS